MSGDTAFVEFEDTGVARLVLSRPEARNALSVDLCRSVSGALTEIRDSDARVVVIQGEGSVFCSGADLAVVSGPGALGFLPAFEAMLEEIARFPLPTIARIQGAALGGGFQLATVCDFRIATTTAKLGIPSSRLGIVINFENVERLVLLAGVATAKEILMTARAFTGSDAATRGLVTAAVEEARLDAEVDRFAASVAELAPRSVRGAKRAIALVQDQLSSARRRDPGAVEVMDRLVADAYSSADLAEGIRSMQEKRAPRFDGS